MKKPKTEIVLPSRESMEMIAEIAGDNAVRAFLAPKPKRKKASRATRVPSVETEWGKRVMERMGNGDVRLYRQNSAKIFLPNKNGTKRCLTAGPEVGCGDLTGNDVVTGLRIEIELKMPGKTRTPQQIVWGVRMCTQNVIYQLMTYDDAVSLQENLDREQADFEFNLFQARRRCGYARNGVHWRGCLRVTRITEGQWAGLYVVTGEGVLIGPSSENPWTFSWGDHGFDEQLNASMVFYCQAEKEHDYRIAKMPADVGEMLRAAWGVIAPILNGLP